MSSSAPRFASFRPKPKAPDQTLTEEPRRKPERTEHSSTRDKVREGRKRSSPREKRRISPSREKSGYHAPGDSSRRLYFSDRRGDHDIVKYGTPNRYETPSYRRSGYGNILGIPGQKIDRDHSTDQNLVVVPLVRQRQKRMLTDKHAARETQHTLRLVKVTHAEAPHADATRDFIALSSNNKKRIRGSGSDSEGGEDEVLDTDYRGIDGTNPKPNVTDEADTYYESDTEAALARSAVMQKNSRLILETRNEPGNLQAWLDLVEHQESMMKMDRAISELSTADRQNLADVRISTYEEALRKIGNDELSQIELQVRLLREAQRVWDDTRVTVKWQAVLGKYPHSAKLWFGFLDFIQSEFSKFKYEDCRAFYLQALKAVQSNDSENRTTTPEVRMHLFVRLTTMIQQAGYQELALAAWQAVFEFEFLAPHDLVTDGLQQFEAFWESEAPRIGEPNCRGWRHTSNHDEVPQACPIILEEPDCSATSLTSFQRRETDSINQLRYPGRSSDEIGENDPFHTIFFSDLKELVANFPKLSPEAQVDAFLCFCGLPQLITQKPDGPWRSDIYLQSRISCAMTLTQTKTRSLQYQEALIQYMQSPLMAFQMTRDLLVQQDFSLQVSRLNPEFIRTTLKLLATNTSDSESIGEYLLSFESRYFPSDVVKNAKRLLRDQPSSVRLYNMYGVIEDRRGNSVKAGQIFAAALNIKTQPVDHMELLNSYIWQALHDNDRIKALHRLMEPIHQAQPPQLKPALSETIRNALQLSLTDALLSKDYASAIIASDHLALLVYLSSDCNASAALEVYNNLTAWFASHRLSSSTYAERHAQAIARLLTYHLTHASIVKPALIRTALEPLIATFPSNTVLLSAFAANEARFAIDDRVRGNMYRVLNLSPQSSVTTWTFAIHHEILKGEIAGSTSHSVRALYKRATNLDASGAHCSAIWQMYMQFELDQWLKEQSLRPTRRPYRNGKKSKWETRPEEAEERIKETFYQGLKMLPWCKDFIMLAFTTAKDFFSEEELWGLYRVMMEKEMRVYVEVDGPHS